MFEISKERSRNPEHVDYELRTSHIFSGSCINMMTQEFMNICLCQCRDLCLSVTNVYANSVTYADGPGHIIHLGPTAIWARRLGPTAYQLPQCSHGRRDSHAEVNRNPSQDHGWLRAGSSEARRSSLHVITKPEWQPGITCRWTAW